MGSCSLEKRSDDDDGSGTTTTSSYTLVAYDVDDTMYVMSGHPWQTVGTVTTSYFVTYLFPEEYGGRLSDAMITLGGGDDGVAIHTTITGAMRVFNKEDKTLHYEYQLSPTPELAAVFDPPPPAAAFPQFPQWAPPLPPKKPSQQPVVLSYQQCKIVTDGAATTQMTKGRGHSNFVSFGLTDPTAAAATTTTTTTTTGDDHQDEGITITDGSSSSSSSSSQSTTTILTDPNTAAKALRAIATELHHLSHNPVLKVRFACLPWLIY